MSDAGLPRPSPTPIPVEVLAWEHILSQIDIGEDHNTSCEVKYEPCPYW